MSQKHFKTKILSIKHKIAFINENLKLEELKTRSSFNCADCYNFFVAEMV